MFKIFSNFSSNIFLRLNNTNTCSMFVTGIARYIQTLQDLTRTQPITEEEPDPRQPMRVELSRAQIERIVTVTLHLICK